MKARLADILRLLKRIPFNKKWLIPAAILAFVILSSILATVLYRVYRPMINLHGRQEAFLYIKTGAGFRMVMDSLEANRWLEDRDDFIWLSGYLDYDKKVKPGRYRLTPGMTNHQLASLLRSGRQSPVRVTILNARTPAELSGKISRRLEPDSAAWMKLFRNDSILGRYGADQKNLFLLFIPDTYEVYWNIQPAEFLEKMAKRSTRFWDGVRKERADSLGLSPASVVTLASIIEKETNNDAEKPVIAGVYLNRLRIGMALQADPTVVFASGDFTLRRVTGKHTAIESPYNTYLHTGLPPGPICLPSVASIDAVLKPGSHGYLYFCAKSDLSGTHVFAATLGEHQNNARKFHAALNRMKIR